MLSDSERQVLAGELRGSARLFIDTIAGLSMAQWNYRPAEGAWTIAEVAEHVVNTEATIWDRLHSEMLARPAAPELRTDTGRMDHIIAKRIAQRGSNKAEAPAPMRPVRPWSTVAEILEAFQRGRDRTVRYAETTRDDLRSHFAEHPLLQRLDAYQWLMLVSKHTERHVAQIEEAKAATGYPGRA